jgi:hypothetical protein
MSPVFFIFPLAAALFINKQKKYFKILLTILCLVPGLIFFSTYLRPDIRVVASDWMNQNIPASSTIFSEGGNVINLPINSDSIVINYDFYSQPSPTQISTFDYVLVPSRRVFKNNFAPEYYQKLFSGSFGFKLKKLFSPPSEFFLDSENAEETWSVFDHPTIRLYSK